MSVSNIQMTERPPTTSPPSYVVLTATGTLVLNLWHALRTGPFRRAAGIAYPQSYAEASDFAAAAASAERKQQLYLFNCAQRSHANFLEHHTSALVALLLGGLVAPRAATTLGVGWTAARIMYAVGYTKRDQEKGKGRLMGGWFWFCEFGLMGLAGWSGYEMVMAGGR